MTWTLVFQLILLACVAAMLVIAVAGAFRSPNRPLRGDTGPAGMNGAPGRDGAMGPPGPPCTGPCCRPEKGTAPW